MEEPLPETSVDSREEPTDDMRAVVGSRLRALREARNLSASELADRVGVSRQTIFTWETGQKAPTDHNFQKLSSALNLKLSRMLARLYAGY